ncbi:hypothetical protein P1X14_16505 [Sphingomonas sp. AOB5]|uniref:hypothetical protein n=1 Tax=Sphingomonas sp. AOB5 TaxID=3034017 RepID=UPI0023F64AEE|nr:hypothetical protein [Sphingomonas sp. AOB5]MDF7776860.1 hypothetical protein [Sphingomonas sp. AOB5]
MSDPIPIPRLAAAVLLGTLPALLFGVVVLAIWSEIDSLDTLRPTGVFAMFMIGAAVFPGIPAAAIFLRDPEASTLRWTVVGAVNGLIAISLVEMWIFGLSAPLMLLTFAGPLILMLNGATLVLGALAGLGARYAATWLTNGQ